MIAVILGSLFLIASVTWLLWSAFSPYAVWQRKDVLFQICYGMYGFMDLVCIGKTMLLNVNKLSVIRFLQLSYCHQLDVIENVGVRTILIRANELTIWGITIWPLFSQSRASVFPSTLKKLTG